MSRHRIPAAILLAVAALALATLLFKHLSHPLLWYDEGAAGDLEEARYEFERSLELQRSTRGWVGLSFVEVASGHSDAAKAALVQAVNAEPQNPEAWARAAGVWVALGDTQRAHASVTRALELAPDRDDLRQQLARIELAAAAGG
jgi:tetratricopeptide (TPR) repeat protein